MATLSLAMIMKDEEKTLERVLTAAKSFCDELIVVDTGSTDRSIEIAEAMGATVHHFEWIDDFAAARNYAFSKCTGDWIIWLDADDDVTEADQAKIRELKSTTLNTADLDAIMLMYQYRFNDANKCMFSFHRERLIRRESGLKWEYPVHECIVVHPQRVMFRLDINIQHRQHPDKFEGKRGRNLRILEKAIQSGDRSPRNVFYYANELRDNRRFEEAIEIYKEYLTISPVEWEKYAAFLNLSRCCFELSREEEALDALGKAILLDSERAEAFNQLGIYHYKRKNWRKAIPFFLAAASLPKPSSGFVNDGDYSWVPHDYVSICYERINQAEKAIQHAIKAFANHPDPSHLHKNLHIMVDRL